MQNKKTQMGKLVFQKRNLSAAILHMFIGLAIATVGLMVVLIQNRITGWGVTIILWGGVAIAFSMYQCFIVLRCYESGVERVSPLRRVVIPFQDVTVLTYKVWRRNLMNMDITLRISANKPKAAFRFSLKNLQVEDPLFIHLRNEIALNIKERAQEKLMARGLPFDWTSAATIQRDGLRLKRRSFLKSEEERLPFAQIASFEIANGRCALYRHNNPKLVVRLKCSGENFYPGVLLLEDMLRLENPIDTPIDTMSENEQASFRVLFEYIDEFGYGNWRSADLNNPNIYLGIVLGFGNGVFEEVRVVGETKAGIIVFVNLLERGGYKRGHPDDIQEKKLYRQGDACFPDCSPFIFVSPVAQNGEQIDFNRYEQEIDNAVKTYAKS